MATPVVVLPADAPREEWHRARQKGIGASDAAAVVGLSPWKGPYALWLEKTGQVDPAAHDSENEAMYWGSLLEEPIARRFSEETGLEVVRPQGLLRHGEIEFMLATPDFEVADDGAPVQIKTSSAWKADEWGDEPPDHYQLQVLHEMDVKDADHGWLAVLIGGQRYRHYRIERNERLIAQLRRLEEHFWTTYVEGGEMPPIDTTQATVDSLDQLTVDADLYVDLQPEHLALIDDLDAARSAVKAAEERKQELEVQIKALLRHGVIGRVNGVDVVTWKPQVRRSTDVKALARAHPTIAKEFERETEVRPLRIVKRKTDEKGLRDGQ